VFAVFLSVLKRISGKNKANQEGKEKPMKKWRFFTRRDFLRGTAGGVAGLAFGLPGPGRALEKVSEKTTRVVLVRHAEVLDEKGKINEKILAQMLDDAVSALFSEEDPSLCWQKIIGKEDVLGIKSNIWQPLPTPRALEKALRERALGVGISERNISIEDQGILDDRVFKRATALINVRPLRTHHWSGIGGCLKNYIMFVREPWKWHDDSCADLGGLWHLPVCAGKTRLNILVVLTPLFHGIGPHHFDPRHVWSYNGLLVGRDPVALDAVGVKLLAEKRKRFFDRPPRGGTSAKHVQLAQSRHRVGIADLDRIELLKIGWQEGILI
jgi:hypothetical protein